MQSSRCLETGSVIGCGGLKSGRGAEKKHLQLAQAFTAIQEKKMKLALTQLSLG
jgi:hypothetical protein